MMRCMADEAPPAEVVHAFGLRGEPSRLPGGQGSAWRVADVVLKPRADPTFQAWLGTELAGVDQVGFVLSDVVRATDGRWVVDGWGATTLLVRSSSKTLDVDWLTVLSAGRAFHRATRELPRPAWLAARSDWWAQADRAAWDEQSMEVIPRLQPLVDRLRQAVAPLGRDQLVHADLTGNVLVDAATHRGSSTSRHTGGRLPTPMASSLRTRSAGTGLSTGWHTTPASAWPRWHEACCFAYSPPTRCSRIAPIRPCSLWRSTAT